MGGLTKRPVVSYPLCRGPILYARALLWRKKVEHGPIWGPCGGILAADWLRDRKSVV